MGKRGLLLLNLGSPDAPTTAKVRPYLIQFLTDPYVIDIPAPLRHLLVRLIIAPFRAPKSAHAYKQIWTPQGSPLVQNTREFAKALQAEVAENVEVRWAMRYGKPSVKDVLKDFNVDEIDVIPLYPQYAESSSRTAIEDFKREVTQIKNPVNTRILRDFYDQGEFIDSLAKQILDHQKRFAFDHLLFSFHGLPERHLKKLHSHCFSSTNCCAEVGQNNRWCYRAQSMATAHACAKKLGVEKSKYSVSFQSRLGRDPWIKPYTDVLVEDLIKSGVKKLLVSCPSFVADCLETLEEIQMRLKEQFVSAGGEDLQMVKSLNFEDHWVKGFNKMIERKDLKWDSLNR